MKEVRRADVAISVDALAQQWGRQEGAPAGCTYVVEREIAARTRGGTEWRSDNAVAVATIARPMDLTPAGAELGWLAAGLAVCDAVDDLTGELHECHWPDGVGIGDEPRAGVAVNASSHLGPGVVEHTILVGRIDLSVLPECPRPVIEGQLIDTLQASVKLLDDPSALIERYRGRCATMGQTVRALLLPQGTARGTATGLTDSGALVLETSTGMRETLPISVVRLIERAGPRPVDSR